MGKSRNLLITKKVDLLREWRKQTAPVMGAALKTGDGRDMAMQNSMNYERIHDT